MSIYHPAPTESNSPDAVIVQAIIGLPMRLKAHRAARRISQRHVARECGVSFSTICRIERGEDYTVDNLITIAAYLDGEAAR